MTASLLEYICICWCEYSVVLLWNVSLTNILIQLHSRLNSWTDLIRKSAVIHRANSATGNSAHLKLLLIRSVFCSKTQWNIRHDRLLNCFNKGINKGTTLCVMKNCLTENCQSFTKATFSSFFSFDRCNVHLIQSCPEHLKIQDQPYLNDSSGGSSHFGADFVPHGDLKITSGI